MEHYSIQWSVSADVPVSSHIAYVHRHVEGLQNGIEMCIPQSAISKQAFAVIYEANKNPAPVPTQRKTS